MQNSAKRSPRSQTVRPLEIAANERETVRVFVVNLDAPDANVWAKVHHNIETAIGVPLDAAHVESFPAQDLKGLGLAQFLVDGYGIAEADVAPDRKRLDAAGPQIVLLRARAFKGAAVTLSPRAPVELIAAYGLAQADPSRPTAPRPLDPALTDPKPPAAPTSNPRGPLLAILIFLGLAVMLFIVLIVAKL